MVSHLVLSSKIKRLLKNKKKEFLLRSSLKQFSLDERMYAEKKNLLEILQID